MTLTPIIDRVLSGQAVNPEEALRLYNELPLSEIGILANERRESIVTHPDIATYIIDRNINYTNVCNADCIFCAFYRKPGHAEGYTHSYESLEQKVSETIALGGNQILLQGGHNPELGIEYYENLFRHLKTKFDIKLHALSPSEIIHITEVSKIPIETVLQRLIDAGLDSIPGGGAEILVDGVRKKLMRHKVSSQEWLDVMEKAHGFGLRTTATMMFGHVETVPERIEHMLKLEALQRKTGGFTAFISWTFQKENTKLQKGDFYVSPNEYLRTLALSRLIMPSFVNFQVSFVTLGKETATLGLHFGGNDYGSAMIEENVVKAAGADNPMTELDIRREIRLAGFIPRRRTMQYELLADSPRILEQELRLAAHSEKTLATLQ